MKKHLLLIALFTVVFLGLGSYSSADCMSDCDANVTIKTTFDNCVTEANKIVDAQSKLAAIGECSSTLSNSLKTCKDSCTPQTTTTSSTKCEGGSVNALGICICPTGTKNIDGICTSCKAEGVCCGISLNTSVPFIGKCIEDSASNVGGDETGVTGETAFPVLMGSLTKILVTAILILSFVLIVIGGIMIATGNPGGGRKMIVKVVIGIALLGASGVILRLINPNFFG